MCQVSIPVFRRSCIHSSLRSVIDSTSIWMVLCFTSGEEGRGLPQVNSGMRYGLMSCFPVCLLSSEQRRFHHKQAIPSSFILRVLCHFLLHMMKNSKKKSKEEVLGLVCCGVSTSPLLCLITKRERPHWVFLLVYLSRSPGGLFVWGNYLVLYYR